MARFAVHVSLSSKRIINLWFVLTRCSPFGRRSARAPDDRRRTIVLYGWLIETLFWFGLPVHRDGPVAQLVRAHA